MKTASMTKFDYAYLGALIFQLFFFIAAWDWLMMDIHEQIHARGGDTGMQVFVAEFYRIGILAGFAVSIIIWLLISVARLGFMRYILALLVAFSGVSLIGEFMVPGANWYFLLSYVVIFALNCAAIFFVFQPDAAAWLRREV